MKLASSTANISDNDTAKFHLCIKNGRNQTDAWSHEGPLTENEWGVMIKCEGAANSHGESGGYMQHPKSNTCYEEGAADIP